MYTYFQRRGVIVRIADGVVVAPSTDTNSQDYLEWLSWCEAGNSPAIGEETDPTVRIISRLQFRRRFTLAERVAVDASADPVVRTMLTDMSLAEEIDLDDADIVNGLAYLEQVGLVAAGRPDEIRA